MQGARFAFMIVGTAACSEQSVLFCRIHNLASRLAPLENIMLTVINCVEGDRRLPSDLDCVSPIHGGAKHLVGVGPRG